MPLQTKLVRAIFEMLEADTVYRSNDKPMTAGVEKGSTYELRELVNEKDLPPTIDLVWHGINDRENLRAVCLV